jgi:RNA polymerase sigma factor, sigma-70 family
MIRQSLEEIDLINSAVRNGDNEAWRHIYSRCYGAVKKILFKKGFTGQDAEDLTHQIFVKIINSKKKPYFENPRCFYGWLKCTVSSVVTDTLRSKAAKDDKMTVYFDDIKELDIEVPQEQVSDGYVGEKIKGALEKLSEKERKLIILRANGTPFKTISCETGIPINGIRVYFQRAAKKLRELLQVKEKAL